MLLSKTIQNFVQWEGKKPKPRGNPQGEQACLRKPLTVLLKPQKPFSIFQFHKGLSPYFQ